MCLNEEILGSEKLFIKVSDFYNKRKQKQLYDFKGQIGCMCTFALQESSLRKERTIKTITTFLHRIRQYFVLKPHLIRP